MMSDQCDVRVSVCVYVFLQMSRLCRFTPTTLKEPPPYTGRFSPSDELLSLSRD